MHAASRRSWGRGNDDFLTPSRNRFTYLGIGVYAVECEGVEVKVEIECGSESLDEGDGTTALCGPSQSFCRKKKKDRKGKQRIAEAR
jgi:hypothetical protein